MVPRRPPFNMPDGAFAPSETFSPNLPAPINARPRIKRSGRGECPVPPRLMGHTPSGSGDYVTDRGPGRTEPRPLERSDLGHRPAARTLPRTARRRLRRQPGRSDPQGTRTRRQGPAALPGHRPRHPERRQGRAQTLPLLIQEALEEATWTAVASVRHRAARKWRNRLAFRPTRAIPTPRGAVAQGLRFQGGDLADHGRIMFKSPTLTFHDLPRLCTSTYPRR